MTPASTAEKNHHTNGKLSDSSISSNDILLLKRWFGIASDDERRLKALRDATRSLTDRLQEILSEHESSFPELAQSISFDEEFESLESLLEEVSNGRYDKRYFERRIDAHDRATCGADGTKWRAGLLSTIFDLLKDDIAKLGDNKNALEHFASMAKILMLDLALSMEAAERKNKSTAEENFRRLNERTTALLDGAINTAIYSVDMSGRVLGWNKGAENIFGYSAQEIIGVDFRKFYPAELVASGYVDREMQEVMTKNQIATEGWRIAKGGRQFYGKVIFSARRNAAGEIVALVKSVTDETERKRAEETNSALINGAINTAICALDISGKIQGWNKGAEHIFGYAADEIVGKNVRTFYPQDLLNIGYVDKEIEETIATGTVKREGWRLAKGGRLFYARVVLTAQKDKDGNVTNLVKTVTDETERKKLEDVTNALLNGAVNTAIYAVDLTGKILGWNAGAQNIFGYTPEEVIGQDFRRFYPQDLLAKGYVEQEIRECIATGMVTGLLPNLVDKQMSRPGLRETAAIRRSSGIANR